MCPCIGEPLVKPRLIASTEGSAEVPPAVFDSPACVPIGRTCSPHRYRLPGPPAVHASSRGFAAIEVVSPEAVRPVPTLSGVPGRRAVRRPLEARHSRPHAESRRAHPGEKLAPVHLSASDVAVSDRQTATALDVFRSGATQTRRVVAGPGISWVSVAPGASRNSEVAVELSRSTHTVLVSSAFGVTTVRRPVFSAVTRLPRSNDTMRTDRLGSQSNENVRPADRIEI